MAITITDTTRTLLEDELRRARSEQTELDAYRSGLDAQLADVNSRLDAVTRRVTDLEDDLGITEPIEDPWAQPIPYTADVEPEGAA